MDKPQWGYALFDAGCWGYASVTVSTLAPLVFVRRTNSQKAEPYILLKRPQWGCDF
jgi:hypothetical protein